MTSRDRWVLFFAALVAIAAAIFGAWFSSRVMQGKPKTEQAPR
jgi:uncharacterized membrane protein YfcA